MLVTDNLTSSYTTTVQGAQLKRIFIFYGSSELHMENIPCDALLQKLHADYWETQSEAHISLGKTAAAPRQSTKHQLECPKMCPVPSTAMWGTAFLLPDYCRRRCLNRLQNVGQRDLAQRDWDLLGQSLPCLPLSYIGFVFVGDSQTSPGSFF